MLAVTAVGVQSPDHAAGTRVSGGSGGLSRFTDCPTFAEYLRRTTESEVGPYGFGGAGMIRPMPMERAAQGSATPAGSPVADAPAAPDAVGTSPTGTNVQERGVDEPDVAKVDGSTLYTLTNGRLTVVDAAGREPKVRGTLGFPAGQSAQELLVLPHHRLLVIGTSVGAYSPGPYPEPGGPVRAQAGMAPRSAAFVRPIRPGNNNVDLTVVDVTDPNSPRTEWVEEIGGSYVSARLHDGVARIVFGSTPHIAFEPMVANESAQAATDRNRATVAAAKAEDFLPTRRVLDATGQVRAQGPLLRCTDVARPASPAGTGIISVLTIDTATGTERFTDARSTGVVANGELVYSSADRLYVATTEGGWNSVRPGPGAGAASAPAERRTAIHAFDTTGRTVTPYVGSGAVPGYLLGRWAFSEHQGYLRVATTTGEPWAPPSGPSSQSSVVVLAERAGALRQVGHVSGLGQGERIRGIRWFDDLAAVVTFRQTDPLYLVDLSSPTSPQVRGELQLTGYSAYLHPTGAGHLLGVGQSADAQGHITGLQAQEFDVSAPTHPTRTGDLDLGRGSTNVESDSRSFTYLTSRHLAVIPAWVTEKVSCPVGAQCAMGPGGAPAFAGEITVPAALGVSVDAHGGLHRAGKFIGDSAIVRVLPIGDRLVAITGSSVYLLDPDSFAPIGSTRLTPGPGPR